MDFSVKNTKRRGKNKSKGKQKARLAIVIIGLLIAIGCVLLVINNAFHIESVALKKCGIILLLIPGVPLAIILLYCIIAVAFSCAYLILFPILFLIGVVFYLAMALVPIVIVISVIKRKQTDE